MAPVGGAPAISRDDRIACNVRRRLICQARDRFRIGSTCCARYIAPPNFLSGSQGGVNFIERKRGMSNGITDFTISLYDLF